MLLGVCSLASCGKSKEYDFDVSSNSSKNNGKATISYAMSGDVDTVNAAKASIEQFELLYPKINVRLIYFNNYEYSDKLAEMILRNQQPDVMEVSYYDLDKYSEDGNGFYNLSNLANTIDFTTFDEKILRLGRRNNSQVGVPISICSVFPVYNQNLIEKFDLDISNNLLNFKDYIKTLRPYKIYPFGMDKKDTLIWILSYYEQCYGFSPYDKTGKSTINEQYLQEVFELYKQLVTSKIVCPVDEYTDELFLKGNVLGTIINSNELYILNYQASVNKLNITVGDYFKIQNVKHSGIYYLPTSLYAINKDTNHPNEAAILINYLLNSKENALIQNTLQGVPASFDAETVLMEYGRINDNEFIANVSANYYLDEGSIMPVILEDKPYIDACIEIIVKYINNEITVEQAVSDFANLR